MLSEDYLYSLLENISSQLNEKQQEEYDDNCKKDSKSNYCMTSSQALVVLGILGGVLTVESLQIDKNQTVYIVLQGSLKRKTKMDKILDQMGSLSFGEVMKALFERFG